jgi:hypothetical protein
VRPSTSPAKHQSSPKSVTPKGKPRRPQSARRHSSDSKQSSSYSLARKEKELAKTYNLPGSKHKDEKLMSKKPARIYSPQRSLDEESLYSVRSAHHLEASRKLRKGVDRKYGENKHEHFYAESVSSRNSKSNETRHDKEKLVPADTRTRSAKILNVERHLENETVSSTRSSESKTRKRNEKFQNEKPSRSIKSYKSPEQILKDKIEKTRGSRSRESKRSSVDIQQRGRSPTPEMRTAGQSRRHHLDITTGSNNPLATGPDRSRIFESMEYERVVYDPSRYSDVGSLTSTRSRATWSDRGS